MFLSFRCSLSLHFRIRTNKKNLFFSTKQGSDQTGRKLSCLLCYPPGGGCSELGRPRPLMAKYAELRPLRLRPGRRRGRGQNRRRRPPAGHVAAPRGDPPLLLSAPAVRYATVPRQRLLVFGRGRRRPSRKLGGGEEGIPPFTFASLLPLAFLRCLLGICGLRPAARPCGSLLLAGSSRFVRPPGGIAEVWGLLGGVPVVSCCLVGEHCEGAQDGAGD